MSVYIMNTSNKYTFVSVNVIYTTKTKKQNKTKQKKKLYNFVIFIFFEVLYSFLFMTFVKMCRSVSFWNIKILNALL